MATSEKKKVLNKAIALEKEYTDKLTNMYVTACIVMAEQLKVSKISSDIEPKKLHNRVKAIVNRAFEEMEEQEENLVDNYAKQFLLLGAVGAIFDNYKSGISLLVPVNTTIDTKQIKWLMKASRLDAVLNISKDIENSIKRLDTINNIAKKYKGNEMAVEIARAISKAARILRTETGRIENKATYEVGKYYADNKYRVMKRWDATLDKKTRESHAEIHGEKIDIYEVFSNGLRYPLDELGEPEEVINCRCKLKLAVYSRLVSTTNERIPELERANSYDEFLREYTKKRGNINNE